ncbi:MAG: hypothetical protein ACI4AK_02140 [Lepagella sp.]
MKQLLTVFFITILSLNFASAKEVRDTILTQQRDRIILSYNISIDDNEVRIDPSSHPRIIASERLKQACKGHLDKLKVVAFDRIGDLGKVEWSGMTPSAITAPSGLRHERSAEGYYIFGECLPMTFVGNTEAVSNVKIPIYIAIYEKKQKYRIITSGLKPLKVKSDKHKSTAVAKSTTVQKRTETERIAIQTTEEIESDNEDLTRALSCIGIVNELLDRETEVPFSTTLQAEISNLISFKSKLTDSEILEKINQTLLKCDEREREIKESQNSATLSAKAQEEALLEQQKQEAEKKEKEAEEKARLREEKQQKRSLWMIIGCAILAILGFVFNAIFKHFRDLKSQKNFMQMQESLAHQAEHEVGRRTREIVRNKAHQVANKGRVKIRQNVELKGRKEKNNKPRTI